MSEVGRLSTRYPKARASVSKARKFVRLFADCIGADGLADDLALIVSELVTNAVLHGRTAPGRQVEVTLDHSAGRVRVEVRDTGEGMPRRRPRVPLAVSGRGLEIVDSLSEKWGVTAQIVGKTVWAELVVKPSESAG
ncbi:ATP-binding protein [Streptomyces sp. SID2999]|uniref:ATP-binding protein n=1 Tax=Streptomyces sp. SID2999 TaxID=2690258 RepID=UPI001368084F|nr:ATP-binding protein [Streptomyces sp. SID2999]MYZ11474.1 ATP-binding protein [Streptomyces sp. SID2999]